VIGAALLFAAAQIVPTHCQTAVVPVLYDPNGARVITACDDSLPDDLLWNLDRADQVSGDLDGKFNRRIDGRGSVIYVIDSGILADHDEFMTATGSRVIAGVDLLAGVPGGAMPCGSNWALAPCTDFPLGVMIDGHGTAVASVAAGNRVGVAPGATLVSIRALGFVKPTPERFLAAFDAVIKNAWDPATPQFRTGIVTLSFGLDQFDGRVDAMIRRMVGGVDRDGNPDPNGKRFFFTFFGGNVGSNHCDDNGNILVYPSSAGAAINGAVTVGGLSKPNEIWSGSCRSAGIEVWAPAADLVVASLTGHDHYHPLYISSGTSYAAPYVAGIAARMLQRNPSLTPEEIEAAMKASPARVDGGGAVPVFVPPDEVGRRRAVR
jgi:hypothetical protein